MKTSYFRINQNEYCHITDDKIFISSTKENVRIPLEYTLGEGWGIFSLLNYFLFVILLVYFYIQATTSGAIFFKNPLNYGAVFILFYSLARIKKGFITSKTPTITRSKISAVHFKTPRFSYPQLVIYFEGPEGKTLKKTISVLYKKEAIPVLTEAGLIAGA